MKETLSLSELENYDPHGLKRGSRWRFLCPLCGDGKPRDKTHRSVSVDGSTGGWKCHRCESQGKLKEYWEDRPMIPKQELQKQALKRKFALTPTTKQPETREIPVWLPESYSKSQSLFGEGITPASEYLQSRGVSWEVACCAGVGYAAEWRAGGATSQRVIFPVNDQSGALVAVQARAIATQVDGPKFISSGPKSLGVFLTSSDALCLPVTFITEAPIDALSLAMCGFNGCATLGKDWPAWLPKSLAFRMVGVGYDNDTPGEEAAVKLATSLEAVGAFVFRVRPPEEVKDWNEALTTYGVMITGAYIAMAVDQARSEFQCSHDFIDNLLVCIRRGIEAGELDGHQVLMPGANRLFDAVQIAEWLLTPSAQRYLAFPDWVISFVNQIVKVKCGDEIEEGEI